MKKFIAYILVVGIIGTITYTAYSSYAEEKCSNLRVALYTKALMIVRANEQVCESMPTTEQRDCELSNSNNSDLMLEHIDRLLKHEGCLND